MKGRLMDQLIELLNFLVSPMYKLAIHDYIQFDPDLALPPIPHKVDDVWIEHLTADQLLHDRTYQGTHYRYLPSTILSPLQVDGDWFRRLTTCMLLAALLASPCSTAEYTYLNNVLIPHTQNFDPARRTAFYNCMWYPTDRNPQTRFTDWMNRILEREPSFASKPRTYICNCFALRSIIFDEDFQMETTIEQINIDKLDYMVNPHSRFYFYSHLLNIIDFQNRFSFPAPVYTYPLPTMASVHTLTPEELLNRPTLGTNVEPLDEELLDMLIFDLNMAKLPPSTDVSAFPTLAATADLTATTTQINNFLKLTLDDISTLTPVRIDESTLVQPATIDAEINTTMDQTLNDIPEETTADQSTAMDVAPQEPAAVAVPPAPVVDHHTYLATPAILPGPPIISTVATAKYSAPEEVTY
uniref:Uncharacterized protein n=1 Tax=Romanomermis culicivorax TaxID=13658 RepID=A0A915KR72_ROMCU